MKQGVYVACLNELGDPKVVVQLAETAQDAGWDGFFLYDHIFLEQTRTIDPWVTLGAVAHATRDEMQLGTLITPVARRHPAKLAHEVATLVALAGNRVVLGVGLGHPTDYAAVGDVAPPTDLAWRMDRGLEAIRPLVEGACAQVNATHQSEQVYVRGTFDPSMPAKLNVWCGGTYWRSTGTINPGPLRRAAKSQGFFPVAMDWDPANPISVNEFEAVMSSAQKEGMPTASATFQVVACGHSNVPTDITAYRDLGANWWREHIDGSLADAQSRIKAGPISIP